MNNAHGLIAAALLLASPFFVPHPARAAQSYDNCTGYIDSLPATISTGGTWCLRKDLATDIASGSAIDIASDDVTVDCNDFKIGGLAAGPASDAYGIFSATDRYAPAYRNTSIRHCNIRGFSTGIALFNVIGALIEDNRLDNNLGVGIEVHGSHNRIRRNAVFDTGGHASPTPNGLDSYGILASADVTDNIIDGVFASGDYGDARGISASGDGVQVSGNRIGGLLHPGAYGMTYGIDASLSLGAAIAGNRISSPVAVDATHGNGISGSGYCSGNTIANFATPLGTCEDDGGNASN
jgi:parallel beta-helix repeat protein